MFEIILIIAIILIGKAVTEIRKQDPNEYYPNPNRPYQSYKPQTKYKDYGNKDYGSYANSYVKTPLLTKRESVEYQALKVAANKRNLLICPKVRLLDLVVPKQDARNSKNLLNRVMSKHVDFVICNQDMEVICIIELDDTTHLRQDRIERDQFVDTVLKGAGYKIIHTWSITPDILDFLDIRIVRNGPTFEEWKAQREKEQQQNPPKTPTE